MMRRKPTYSGKFELRDEPDSKLHVIPQEMAAREQEVKGKVRAIIFSGVIDKANGLFSEQLGITLSWTFARDAYIAALMPAAILFSSIAVECAMNQDARMRPVRQKQFQNMEKNNRPNPSDWLMLSNDTLRKAKIQGLPVNELMNKGESIATKSDPTIMFIERRNKIAHGDYRAFMVGFEQDYGGPSKIVRNFPDVPGSEALDQFNKASAFLTAWISQGPDLPEFF
jgi:hypothetical protein